MQVAQSPWRWCSCTNPSPILAHPMWDGHDRKSTSADSNDCTCMYHYEYLYRWLSGEGVKKNGKFFFDLPPAPFLLFGAQSSARIVSDHVGKGQEAETREIVAVSRPEGLQWTLYAPLHKHTIWLHADIVDFRAEPTLLTACDSFKSAIDWFLSSRWCTLRAAMRTWETLGNG